MIPSLFNQANIDISSIMYDKILTNENISDDYNTDINYFKLNDENIYESYNKKWKDLIFSIFFIINTFIIIILGLSTGIRSLEIISSISYSNDDNIYGKIVVSDFIGGLFLALSLAIIFSLILISILSRLSKSIINDVSIPTSIVIMIIAISLFTAGYVGSGVALLLLAISYLIFYMFMESHVEFASVMLKTACVSLKQSFPSLILVTVIILSCQAIYCVFWMLAVIGIATNESNKYINISGTKYQLNQCETVSLNSFVS